MEEGAVLFDMASVCERWGATEAEVTAIASRDAGLMCAEYRLPSGSPLWDSLNDAEKVLPELTIRDAKGAVAALRAALAAADEHVGRMPEGNKDGHEWIYALEEERWFFIRQVLENRQERAA